MHLCKNAYYRSGNLFPGQQYLAQNQNPLGRTCVLYFPLLHLYFDFLMNFICEFSHCASNAGEGVL